MTDDFACACCLRRMKGPGLPRGGSRDQFMVSNSAQPVNSEGASVCSNRRGPSVITVNPSLTS